MRLKPSLKKSPGSGKKKPKSKAGSFKISLGKINNKTTSRLAKQGKLKPKEKKKERKDRINAQIERQKSARAAADSGGDGSDNSESDDSVDPEDTSYFDHFRNASGFASADLSFAKDDQPKPKKRKREEDDDEGEEYEQGVRAFASEEDRSNMKMMLPIISNGKVIKRMVKKDQEEFPEEEVEIEVVKVKPKPKVEEEKPTNPKEEERAYTKTLNSAQLFAYRESKLKEKKARISGLAHAILENPQQNMSKLKELRLMLGDTDLGVSLTVRKYAMVSLMEVFKDIIPGYRMRIPSEKEAAIRLKQETKSLLDYETSFLLNYRIYLEFLETTGKMKSIPEKSFLTKHGIHNLKLPGPSAFELGQLAVKCLCELLVAHPHFNYRDNLVLSVVHFTNHGRPEYSTVACDSLKRLFRTDKKGDVILETVRVIGRMVKRLNYDVRPQVLSTFLALKIKEVDFSSISKAAKRMKRTEKMKKLSRRERKNLKLKEKLDKELLETKASEDKSRLLRLHTQVIQAVFETYIRVIKLASDSVLLAPVLQGLAQFAHLINIEYFDSLFAAFRKLIESGVLMTKEILYCLQAAFTVLSGQGSVLNIDPTGFYTHLYSALLSAHMGISDETSPIVLQCLDIMISKRRKQVSQHRILAFMKRICTMCLQQPPDTMMSYLAVIRKFLHTYKYTDILLDADVQGSGVYLPLLEDPEHCCANSSSLWELHLMRHHFEADVRKYSEHVLRGAPMVGLHQLQTEMSRVSPLELYKKYHVKEIFNGKIPEKCPRKKKYRRNQGFVDEAFEDYTKQILESVTSLDSDDDDQNSMDVS